MSDSYDDYLESMKSAEDVEKLRRFNATGLKEQMIHQRLLVQAICSAIFYAVEQLRADR